MSGFAIALIVLEVISLLAIVHLWRYRKMRRWAKVLWTVFLFLPFFGPLFYVFVTVNPDPHPHDEVGPYSGG
jgi:energy-coupling factor transporter transmembrane protein EcfT